MVFLYLYVKGVVQEKITVLRQGGMEVKPC